MSHHMTLQMVDLNHRNLQSRSETLGKRQTHEERTHETGATSEGDGREVFGLDAGTFDSFGYNRNYVLLMCA